MSLVFSAADHVYELDGVVVPSVTGILSASGLIDFSHIPPSVRDAAMKRGSVVHQAIHYHNENDLDVAKFYADFPDYAPYLAGWIDFRQKRRFVPMLNEYRVASRRLQIGGTLDCLGVLDNAAALIDFKTGRPQDVSADLQTSGYLALAIEWANDDVPLAQFFAKYPFVRRYGVQLQKSGAFQIEAYERATDFRDFRCLVESYQIVARRKPSIATKRNVVGQG